MKHSQFFTTFKITAFLCSYVFCSFLFAQTEQQHSGSIYSHPNHPILGVQYSVAPSAVQPIANQNQIQNQNNIAPAYSPTYNNQIAPTAYENQKFPNNTIPAPNSVLSSQPALQQTMQPTNWATTSVAPTSQPAFTSQLPPQNITSPAASNQPVLPIPYLPATQNNQNTQPQPQPQSHLQQNRFDQTQQNQFDPTQVPTTTHITQSRPASLPYPTLPYNNANHNANHNVNVNVNQKQFDSPEAVPTSPTSTYPAPTSHYTQQHTPTPAVSTAVLQTNSPFNNAPISVVGFVTPNISDDFAAPSSPVPPTTANTQNTNPLQPTTITSVATNSAPVENANSLIAKNYKLQHLSGIGFETKLVKKLGQKFVPVRNLETTQNLTRYRLPVKNGNNVDLSIERVAGIVTLTGTNNNTIDNCLKIVKLLDLPESKDGSVTEFVTVENSLLNGNVGTLKRAADLINQGTQNNLRLVQNTPTRNPNTPEASFNPNSPISTPTAAPSANPTPPANPRAATNPSAPNAATDSDESKKTDADASSLVPPNPLDQNANLQNKGGGSILGQVQVVSIDGLDTYVIMGQPNDVNNVLRIIDQIEKISLEYEPEIELVPIKNADALRVSLMVQQLYTQIYASRRGSIIMLPLVKPNMILMIGKKENLTTAKDLVNNLDLAVDPRSQFKIFFLRNAQSTTLYEQIQSFYASRTSSGYLEQQVNIVDEPRTNSLIVQANPRDIKEVEDLIRQLDVKSGVVRNIIKTFTLKNALARELATTLQNTISSSTSAVMGGGMNNTSTTGGSAQTRNPAWVMVDKENGTTQAISVLYDIRITSDARSNMLVVSAPPDTMPLIEMLVNQLDQLPSAESVIKIFTLVNADAYTLTTMLQNLLSGTSTGTGGLGGTGGGTSTNMMTTRRPGIEQGESTLVSVRLVAELRTNSIVAIGSPGDMLTVETILMRLDEDNMSNRKIITIKLVNTPASEIATVIQNYVDRTRQLEIQNITSYMPMSPKEQYLNEIIIVAEPISNTLIISCTPRYYDQLRAIVQKIDERPRIVSIQGLIAEVRINNSNERGFEIGLQDSILFDRSVASATGLPGFAFGTDPSLPTGNIKAGTVASQGISNLGVGRSGSNGIGGFTFSASSESLSVLMRALEERDKLRVLSKPQLTTLHNMRASVSVGEKVPFVGSSTTSYNGDPTYSTDWQDVGTLLDITPRITSDDQIVMSIYVERSSLGSEADGITTYSVGGTPVRTPKVNQAKAQTTVSSMDNQTIIIGGLITEQKEKMNRSVPVLNKIPLVKHLFEYNSEITNRSELLIILTPTIIRSDADMEKLRQQEFSRMHWCLNDVVKLTGKSEMRTRGDTWLPSEVPYIPGKPAKLTESQLPPEEKIKPVIPIKFNEE
ncbi:MAG: hypothetical protein LBQ66_03610 [Planctomycetaceae bacterium]|jgi:type II secretory pathway component GspD/PulD (secretin)|nr:hypothetical protein [Planctomycetaceae bacterium]